MNRRSVVDYLLDFPRWAKRLIVLGADACLCVLTVWLSFYLRLDEWVISGTASPWRPGLVALWSVAVALPVFVHLGFYRMVFRHTGSEAVALMLKGLGIYAAVFSPMLVFVGFEGVPRTIALIQPLLLLLSVLALRLVVSGFLGSAYRERLAIESTTRVLIFGAGRSGLALSSSIQGASGLRVVGFVDDDPRLQGQVLNGLRVYGADNLRELVVVLDINRILLALPSTNPTQRSAVIERLRQARVEVLDMPSLTDLAHGKLTVSALRELDVGDLLGRAPVSPDLELLRRSIASKTLLVTGAGGSIGSEICRQIIRFSPKVLVLVDQNEFSLYKTHQELLSEISLRNHSGAGTTLVPLLASVRDEARMRSIIDAWRPNTVYHAAAYKHVPLVEENVSEGILNNTFGTLCTARVALDCGVEHFVLVSTDKAVRPTNVMGASKRLAEMLLQALSDRVDGTIFSMVRFGNVLDSSGSVVPRFRQQIREGGPITLTHPEITRYFMTIPEASQLVIQAGAMAKGGDVFVLDMGEPVQIMDLARRMVELSGLSLKDEQNPDGDIEITITGLRPGEKLYEELLIGDNPEKTSHPRILRAREEFLPWQELESQLVELQEALVSNDVPAVLGKLKKLVAGYVSNGEVGALVHSGQ
jgi:FlaA1/EpsC-like NDP-sugar epimerase